MRKAQIKLISPSIQALPTSDFQSSINKLIDIGIKIIHIDIMDATITPTLGINPYILKNIDLKNTIIDYHIMSLNPLKMLDVIPILPNSVVHTHFKMISDYKHFIDEAKKKGFKVGITIDLDDNLDKIKDIISHLNYINFMSVNNIGRTGEIFNEKVYSKIEEFRNKYEWTKPISVDGSVREEHLGQLKKLVDVIVVGSILYKNNTWETNLENLNKIINN